MKSSWKFFLLVATPLLVPSSSTAATSFRVLRDEEAWDFYGCDKIADAAVTPGNDPNNNPACMCGFLKDQLEAPPSGIAEAEFLTFGYPAECSSDGYAGPFPCKNVDLLLHMPLSVFNASAANDIWGWTDVSTGREFALLCLKEGTAFVEITNTTNPVFLGTLPTQTVDSFWRDVKVHNDHAFIVSEAKNHGMQVFDLKQLLTVDSSDGPVTFENTAFYDKDVKNAHNIVINEDTGFAYIVGGKNSCDGGLHMVDISNPIEPIKAGCYGADNYTHDAQCVIYDGPDSRYLGQEICFAANADTITIVDVTNKTNPIQLSRTGYKDEGYTHQGWLSPDKKYFVFGDETDEKKYGHNTKILVMDVQDLQNATLAGYYLGPSKAIDHNLYIIDDLVYLASYRAGMRILRIKDYATADFEEIGFFDVYPDDDDPSYNGVWSVYPYFPSGTIIASGIESGLFVLSTQETTTTINTTGTDVPLSRRTQLRRR